MSANIEFKATTGKQHKSEQFHKSSNSFANNGNVYHCEFETLVGRPFQKRNCVCGFYF